MATEPRSFYAQVFALQLQQASAKILSNSEYNGDEEIALDDAAVVVRIDRACFD